MTKLCCLIKCMWQCTACSLQICAKCYRDTYRDRYGSYSTQVKGGIRHLLWYSSFECGDCHEKGAHQCVGGRRKGPEDYVE